MYSDEESYEERVNDYSFLEVPEVGMVTTSNRTSESDNCKFVKAWIGECGEDTVEGEDYCEEHLNETCGVQGCEEQATETCPATQGLVCGVPLCDKHNHEDHHQMF